MFHTHAHTCTHICTHPILPGRLPSSHTSHTPPAPALLHHHHHHHLYIITTTTIKPCRCCRQVFTNRAQGWVFSRLGYSNLQTLALLYDASLTLQPQRTSCHTCTQTRSPLNHNMLAATTRSLLFFSLCSTHTDPHLVNPRHACNVKHCCRMEFSRGSQQSTHT